MTARSLRFFTGDEQGHVKSVGCSQNENKWVISARTIPDVGSSSCVQKLSFLHQDEQDLLAVARSDGTLSVLRASYSDDPTLVSLLETKEDRMRQASSFVGLQLRDEGLYSCTSSGHLRLTPLPSSYSSQPEPKLGSLPTRLREMRLSPSSKTLAYGGDEVNLSVWSIEQALAGKSEASTNDDAKDEKGGKKRKNRELFPGELWRARNEPNDNLDLRQPIQITALAYLSECELVAGNQDGTLRVYDTRSGRRPTAHWKRAMKGSLRSLQSGEVEHQVFAGDAAGTLASFDSRTGRCMYTYRGFASALTALAPIPAFSTTSSAPELLASVGRDRLFRLLSAPKPQADAKKNQEKRGEVLCTEYLPSIPTSVVFAGYGEPVKGSKTGEGEIGRERGEDEEGMEDMGADEEVWEGMQGVGSDEDEAAERRKRRRT